jgi:hypothetical protein
MENILFEYFDERKQEFVGKNNIIFFRGCGDMNRAARFGNYKSPPPICNRLYKCGFCDTSLKFGETENNILFYINTPINEFYLCEMCEPDDNISSGKLISKYKLRYLVEE